MEKAKKQIKNEKAKTEAAPKVPKIKKVDPLKALKREFGTQYNFFRAMRVMGTAALREMKPAKKLLKEGKTHEAERLLKKYQVISLSAFMAFAQEEKETKKSSKKKGK